MSQNSNTLKTLREAIKQLKFTELSIRNDANPKGTIMLRVKTEKEDTVLNIITNDLNEKLFLSILLPLEYEELASTEKDKQVKLYKIVNEFNSICRNLKCFITDEKLGRMIFSTETRHNKPITASSLKNEIFYSLASVKNAIEVFNDLIKGN